MNTPTAARSIPQLRETYVADEVCLVLSADTVLVASKSTAGDWNSVTLLDGQGHSCSCSGFGYRGTCRHLKAAALAVVLIPPAICTPTPAARKSIWDGRSVLAAFATEDDPAFPPRPKSYNVGKEQVL